MNVTPSPSNFSSNETHTMAVSSGTSLYIEEPEWVETARITFQAVIALAGFVGNVMVVLVIMLQPKMKTVANALIRNLAIADLCILMFTFPYAVIKEQAMFQWPLGGFVCRAFVPLLDVFFGVSVWSIAFIALDRYRAIVCVKRPNRERARKQARYTMVFIWLTSFVIICIPLYAVTTLQKAPGYVLCMVMWPNEVLKKVYFLGMFLFWYIIPLTVVIWTFLRISKKLNSSTMFNKRISRELCSDPTDAGSPKMRIREKQNTKAKRILVPVVVVFTVTMFPINAFRLAVGFQPKTPYNKYFWVYYHICFTLVLVNSAANCFIYSIVSKEFRTAFRRLFQSTSRNLSRLLVSSPISIRKRKSEQKTKSSIL